MAECRKKPKYESSYSAGFGSAKISLSKARTLRSGSYVKAQSKKKLPNKLFKMDYADTETVVSQCPLHGNHVQLKAVIKNVYMLEEMQQDSVECMTQALEKYNIEKDIAAHIKEFDKKHKPTWHCIMGRNFHSCMTLEAKHFIYFCLGQVAILMFRSG
ncbi:dynein light chain 1, cytoplasmic-like [Tupaia chinensis]|uniref:dynein light chain 1, cytoplasmic-like n=1 Tax=Tupaia chinensis TaxID=246437 RepID=UPI0003C8CCDE|nr:dynein light chain 1, cytoplasmic-like [Tupaia chinensis]